MCVQGRVIIELLETPTPIGFIFYVFACSSMIFLLTFFIASF
jgi:hypothetical protein